MFHGTITKELTIHEEWNHYVESLIEDQKDFVFVKFNGLHLKSMENLQSCISLRVCIFSNNFVTDIQPLANCSKLIKLDLHGNQIKALPETKFWIGLKYLKLLYLHDNGFAKLKNVCVLSACPSLTALTLFDCPVSLKKGYRHVLVNSIWSLKALDHHVISDEEIIQNWHLPERFRTCNPRLFFNFCPALRKGASYESEINNIKHVISKINIILAHNSPVLIIQKWIRGFFIRKKMSHLFLCKRHQDKLKRSCETKWIYIYQEYKDRLLKDLFFNPEADLMETFTHWKYFSSECSFRPRAYAQLSFPSFLYPSAWNADLLSELSLAANLNIYSPIAFRCYKEHRKYISSILPESKTRGIGIKSIKTRYLIPKGPKGTKDEIEDEDFDDSFRVTVSKLPIYASDFSKDALVFKEQKDAFPSYIQSHPVIHQKPIINRESASERNIIREFFITQRNGMKLKAVCDIDHYYMEEKKQRSHKEKLTAVAVANIARGKAQQTVKESVCKRNYIAQQIEGKHAEAIQKGLQQHWQDRANYIEQVRERRGRFLEEKKRKTADRLLIQDLNNGRTIFSQGIMRANRLRKNTAILKEKSNIVQQKRNMEKYQEELRKQMKKISSQERSTRNPG
ncbi:leucine-rich repeat and IQ domain-containing protein 3 isoform X2 [Echinops telfairi]|uniref:Leucine-rich repeat and IQ domain-containing protein 3 isoform X2 n=1 Tax=Echinops telfairi TaxID=9371 RepID=A0AC55D8R8_ECHTE|nr:leucine-rich repeat and IQ domain-containing protein 3 isoform X2 [Echinops telfairi]